MSEATDSLANTINGVIKLSISVVVIGFIGFWLLVIIVTSSEKEEPPKIKASIWTEHDQHHRLSNCVIGAEYYSVHNPTSTACTIRFRKATNEQIAVVINETLTGVSIDKYSDTYTKMVNVISNIRAGNMPLTIHRN